MTEPKTPESRALDAVVRESKEDFAPRDVDVHWGLVEAKMMERIAREEPPLLRDARATSSRGARAMRAGAIALAAAAAVAVFVRRDREASLLDAPSPTASQEAADNGGALRASEGSGEVRIGGVVASAGHVLCAGDLIEAQNARAIVERPRKVTWLIEQDDGPGKPAARAKVKSTGEPLVLGLEDGAIEAQVMPVPTGEAFAVDVASGEHLVRVAVHGTHLRVTRRGSHVVVDLNEGVVSIGVPPRSGSTYGTLVTAPAHVELDVDDLDRSIHVDHAPQTVRPPIKLAPHEPRTASLRSGTEPNAERGPETGDKPAPHHERAAGPPATNEPAKAAAAPQPASAPSPRDAIASAVRACAASKSQPSDVHVTVSSTLKLRVSASGDVEAAVFDPPLLPEIQTCAAPAIYRTKLAGQSGAVNVPIEFSY